MIDISNYRLLTPANSTLNIEGDITIHYRNGEIEELKDNTDKDINRIDILGVETDDFHLVFHNHDDTFIKNCQRSEDWLQALYYMFNFVVNSKWVEVTQHNKLEFFDAMYCDEDEEQPQVESPGLII